MPNKTIYVSDQDLPVFERAQALAGDNLSATIVQALRHFVEQQDVSSRGFRAVEVEVGQTTAKQNTTIRTRFTGKLLVRARVDNRDVKTFEERSVYQTPKGNFAVHRRLYQDAKRSGWQSEQRLDVYASLDELKSHISTDLYRTVIQNLELNSDVEVLDI
jgi:EXLDI family protein